MKLEFFLASLDDTKKLAGRLAAELGSGDVVVLEGNLGAGKTTLAREVLRAMTGDEGLQVPSPTFTIMQEYDTGKGAVAHFDFYRLKSPDEVVEIGFEDALARGIVLLEWAEKIGGYVPREHLKITLENVVGKPDARKVWLEFVGEKWQKRAAKWER